MKNFLVIILLLAVCSRVSAQKTTVKPYREDFDFFWTTLNDNYCYFNKKHIAWDSVKTILDAQADTITNRASFTGLLERATYCLYDHHMSLGTNTDYSRRLVPTGADMWADYSSGKPMIVEVRHGFGAEKVGIKAGMEVVAVNGVPLAEALKAYCAAPTDPESKSYALRLLLAGDHVAKRKISLKYKGVIKDYYPDADGMLLENIDYPKKVEVKRMGNIGYIKVNNYLYDRDIIPEFDRALDSLMDTKALILDFRETPSGGNTTVARAILGRFISKETYYQKHELWAEEKETGIKRSWMEIVSPHGKTYTRPLVVLGDHWTGSVGEGIVVAFDGIKRATVIGTQLAGLNGAIESAQMPNSKINFNLPTERLYQVNDTPRELFKPTVLVDVSNQKPGPDGDVILQAGVKYLNGVIGR